MSLDIWFEELRPTDVFSANFTHNVTAMWVKAGVYDALYMSQDKLAGEIIPALISGVADMEAKPQEYRALDSPNGWGTYDDALPWLRDVLLNAQEHPEAKIRIWK